MTFFRKPTDPVVEIRFIDRWKHITGGRIPEPATPGSAAIDLVACLDKETLILPRNRIKVSSGFSLHIADPNIAAILLPRSGLGHEHGIVLGNLVGLIDSDYQGEVVVSLWNTGTSYLLRPGDRIAQMLFLPIVHPIFRVVETFTETFRGEGGFGSTGR